MRGVGTKLPIIVHVQGERCLLGGKVVKKGQNHVYVVIKWPLVAPILLLKLNCGVSKCPPLQIDFKYMGLNVLILFYEYLI